MSTQDLSIIHKPESGRFETHVNGLQCEVDYQLDGQIMRMTHTGVPPQLEGRGIAAALVLHALNWAQAQGFKVVPICSYVQVYIKRHPQWQAILA